MMYGSYRTSKDCEIISDDCWSKNEVPPQRIRPARLRTTPTRSRWLYVETSSRLSSSSEIYSSKRLDFVRLSIASNWIHRSLIISVPSMR